MGFIAEFQLSSPLLREATQAVPAMQLEMVDLQMHRVENRLLKYVFWASGGEFDELHAMLASDSVVEDVAFLTEVEDRGLFRVTFSEEAGKRTTYPTASAFDIVYLSLIQSDGESHIRAQVPSREALKSYRKACKERDIPFTLKRLYQEDSKTSNERYNLTNRQYEALLFAYEQGYFGTTREANLEEISTELGITRQALAGRLRRGFERLIRATIA
jgi:predicted DNA binding protein